MWVRNRGERRASERQWSARDIDLLRPSTATRAETRHEGSQASEPRRCENVAALDVVRAPKAVRTASASAAIEPANGPPWPKALKLPVRQAPFPWYVTQDRKSVVKGKCVEVR